MRWILLFLMAFTAPLFANEQADLDEKVEAVLSNLKASREVVPSVTCKIGSEDWEVYEVDFQSEKVTIEFPVEPHISREITFSMWAKRKGTYYTLSGFDPSYKIDDVGYLFQKVLDGVKKNYMYVSSHVYRDEKGYDHLFYHEKSDYGEYKTEWIVTPYNVYILDVMYDPDGSNNFEYFVESCSIVKK